LSHGTTSTNQQQNKSQSTTKTALDAIFGDLDTPITTKEKRTSIFDDDDDDNDMFFK
jgi:hypothetical protein